MNVSALGNEPQKAKGSYPIIPFSKGTRTIRRKVNNNFQYRLSPVINNMKMFITLLTNDKTIIEIFL